MPNEKIETKPKNKKKLCVDDLRHAEYYGMQNTFDELYEKSKRNENFTDLLKIILSRENILLAYRNIKSNQGSITPGTDKLTIKDIGKLSPETLVEKVRYIVTGSPHGYRPKPVRRKDIPKPNGATRPLGIPCIWDRLIQLCIKQVMEPICEAKFSENSHGFRPNRSAEHAVAQMYSFLQKYHLRYVVEFDIKGFFDNVNHKKLIRQIRGMGIRDKKLLEIINRILKAPIKMPNGNIVIPDKGTPQGGIISPLLANIVLNELDKWIESQWENNPVTDKYVKHDNISGSYIKSNAYRAMKSTRLKEMRIVRYADDFRICCRYPDEAERVKIATTMWLKERLKLDVSEEKTRVVDSKRTYTEFLGFKMRLHHKGDKLVVKSHICDKAKAKIENNLVAQAKRIAKPRPHYKEAGEIYLYNTIVMGTQNYYCIATEIVADLNRAQRLVMAVLTNRLRTGKDCRLVKNGRKLTSVEKARYGKSKMLRYVAGTDEPIYPIKYVQHKNAKSRLRIICKYTAEGRAKIHNNLMLNTNLMLNMMRQPSYNNSAEYMDNRISLFSAQYGKCAVTGKIFNNTEEIHCHHIKPRKDGGTDNYNNLVLIIDMAHKLLHATNKDIIGKYLNILNLDKEQIKKLNKLRINANLNPISI